MRKKLLMTICLLITSLNYIKAQESYQEFQPGDHVETIREFQRFTAEYPNEYVFLHTDRQWYYEGDRIWFSAYLTTGPLNLYSPLSEVLYVDIMSEDGTMIQRERIRISEGRGSGNIVIPVISGDVAGIMLRAYTSWMLNFGDDAVFEQFIPVIPEADPAMERADRDPSDEIHVEFMPESGYLVDGISTRVGFKAISEIGKGVEVSGYIMDQRHNIVKRIETVHRGMGVFEFEPEYGRRYFFESGRERFLLPEIKPEGYGLSIREDDDADSWRVQLKSSRVSRDAGYMVFGHMKGEVFFTSELIMSNGLGDTWVPKQSFPAGVVYFTVVSPEGLPVSERLVFNDQETDRLDIMFDTNQDVYHQRQLASVNLIVRDTDLVPLNASASISVFDDLLYSYNHDRANIETWFLLSSDLRGYVEAPGYYFSDDPEAKKHLDILMLTQGWRRYDWDEILGNKEPEITNYIEQGFMISGRILEPRGFRTRPAYEASVVIYKGDDIDPLVLLTDEEGRFFAMDYQFEGSQEFTIRANSSRGRSNVVIELDDPDEKLPVITSPFFQLEMPVSVMEQLKTALEEEHIRNRAAVARGGQEQHIETQMQGVLEEVVFIGDRFAGRTAERTSWYAGRGDHILELDDRMRESSIDILGLLSRLPGVTAFQSGFNYRVVVRTSFMSFGGSGATESGETSESGSSVGVDSSDQHVQDESPGDPLIFIDNIPTDVASLMSLHPSQIASIDVFRRQDNLAIFGSAGAAGVISIRTLRGDGNIERNVRGMATTILQGFQHPVEFFSPRYAVQFADDDSIFDERITVHWDPDVTLRGSRGGRTVYYMPDVESEYRIVVQGMTETGIPFYATKVVTVDSSAAPLPAGE